MWQSLETAELKRRSWKRLQNAKIWKSTLKALQKHLGDAGIDSITTGQLQKATFLGNATYRENTALASTFLARI